MYVTRRLASIVGRKEALRLCATASPLFCEDAHKIGFVDEIVVSKYLDACTCVCARRECAYQSFHSPIYPTAQPR